MAEAPTGDFHSSEMMTNLDWRCGLFFLSCERRGPKGTAAVLALSSEPTSAGRVLSTPTERCSVLLPCQLSVHFSHEKCTRMKMKKNSSSLPFSFLALGGSKRRLIWFFFWPFSLNMQRCRYEAVKPFPHLFPSTQPLTPLLCCSPQCWGWGHPAASSHSPIFCSSSALLSFIWVYF